MSRVGPLRSAGVAALFVAALFAALRAATAAGAEVRGQTDGDITSSAQATGTGASTTVSGGGRIAIDRSGRSPHHGGHHPDPVQCTYWGIGGGLGVGVSIGVTGPIDWAGAQAAGVYGVECVNVVTGAVVRPLTIAVAVAVAAGSPAPPVSARDLAAEATAALEVPVPSPASSPEGGATIVHFPTWLWTGGWESLSASASAGGVTSTVTATPVSVSWDMGDGHALRCRGPGVPYATDRRDRDQHSDCTYSYALAGRRSIDATITWQLTWVAPGNGGGDLGTVSRTATLPIDVVELDTVIRDE